MRARLCLTLAGLVMLAGVPGCGEDAQSPTTPVAEATPSVTAATAALGFRQLTVGEDHTCGVTTDDRAYCWGDNFPGQLGNGHYAEQFCMDYDNCVTQPTEVDG
jgi:alpha-tubulin suppressor-like RCC1 family protein